MKKTILLLATTAVVFGFIGWWIGKSYARDLQGKHAAAERRADRYLGLKRGTLAVGHVSLEALHDGNNQEAIQAIEGMTFSNLIMLLQDEEWRENDYVRTFANSVAEYRSTYRPNPDDWTPAEHTLIAELRKMGIDSQPGEGENGEHLGVDERSR